MTDSETNKVGYQRPPKHSRFTKGKSGNPAGRPKSVRSFKADLAAELQEKLTIVEGGRERRITRQRAFAKTLIAAAIKKDIRAVNALLACMKFFGVGSDEPTPTTTDVADLELIEAYISQQRKKESRNTHPSKPKKRGA